MIRFCFLLVASVFLTSVKAQTGAPFFRGKGRFIVATEQAQHRIIIVDADKKIIVWEWIPANVLPAAEAKWFTNPSDAKAVYNNQYLLVTASGGGVALVRIADKKTVFYAYAGGNTHSAEILPDGNIVSASSTDNYLTLFKVDTAIAANAVYSKRVYIAFGHNAVWDKKRNILWSADMYSLKTFEYNFDCNKPDLRFIDSVKVNGSEGHDLFPVYGEDSLFLTNKSGVFVVSAADKKMIVANTPQKGVKSIASGPANYPIIIMVPQEKWWTDEIKDVNGKVLFKQTGLKMYKARWILDNSFSYPPNDKIKLCK
jgi:hypothetical protein